MPQDYYSLVTNTGLIKEAAAGQIGGNPINLTQIAVGDSNGSYYEPDSAATSLVNELYRASLTSAVLDANNPNQLIIEGVIPEEAGPFYIREVGIFDSDGDLFAIGKYPETFKSNYESGSGKRLYIRLIVAFVSIPNVQIILSENINFDPNFEANLNIELANRLKISENLADLNDVAIARNNLGLGTGALAGDASETEKGISQIADQSETDNGSDDLKFVTPQKLKTNLINHPFTVDLVNYQARSYNTVYQASEDGYLVIQLFGSYMNAAKLLIGTSNPPTSQIGIWGDDLNGNTKAVSACYPISKGTYYQLAPATVGAGSYGFESIVFTFYPVKRS